MITNKNVVVLHTGFSRKQTVEDFQKQKQSGVIFLKCPETQQEIPFRWNGKRELNKIRKLQQEIKNEYKLKMVS